MKYRSGVKGGSAIIVCLVLWNIIVNGTGVMAWKSNMLQYLLRFHQAPTDPCISSPCGPNSQYRSQNNYVVCSCLPGCLGLPPNCLLPECEANEDCANHKICKNGKCLNPCVRFCGINARCTVIDTRPVCSCGSGQTGNPLDECFDITATNPAVTDPCVPSPCGPNSVCTSASGDVVCSCLPGYMGSPPNCRPECRVNGNCPIDHNCTNGKCLNVCIGACGTDATCIAINHKATCTCSPGQTGDPFKQCIDITTNPAVSDPCVPSPCGPNSVCKSASGDSVCSCLPGYMDSPPTCRPECRVNENCPIDQNCTNGKCLNVCIGACGTDATCMPISHKAACTCLPGKTGDPFKKCIDIPIATGPCNPSPCSPNSKCQSSNGRTATCTCLRGYRAWEGRIMENNVSSPVGLCIKSPI